jgi:hypothetical protein
VEEIVTKQLIAQMVEATEKSVADLVEKASNQAIAKKLGKLGEVCRTIVMETKKEFSVADVARQYNDRYPKLPLSEQTIRNKRSYVSSFMTAEGDPQWSLFDRRSGTVRWLCVRDGSLKIELDRSCG